MWNLWKHATGIPKNAVKSSGTHWRDQWNSLLQHPKCAATIPQNPCVKPQKTQIRGEPQHTAVRSQLSSWHSAGTLKQNYGTSKHTSGTLQTKHAVGTSKRITGVPQAHRRHPSNTLWLSSNKMITAVDYAKGYSTDSLRGHSKHTVHFPMSPHRDTLLASHKQSAHILQTRCIWPPHQAFTPQTRSEWPVTAASVFSTFSIRSGFGVPPVWGYAHLWRGLPKKCSGILCALRSCGKIARIHMGGAGVYSTTWERCTIARRGAFAGGASARLR